MTDLTQQLIEKAEKEFDKKFIIYYPEGTKTPDGDLRQIKNYPAIIKDFLFSQIQHACEQTRKDILEKIDPFDLVEDCQPDCTPEQHAYHQGTWNAHLKLEHILESLKEGEGGGE